MEAPLISLLKVSKELSRLLHIDFSHMIKTHERPKRGGSAKRRRQAPRFLEEASLLEEEFSLKKAEKLIRQLQDIEEKHKRIRYYLDDMVGR